MDKFSLNNRRNCNNKGKINEVLPLFSCLISLIYVRLIYHLIQHEKAILGWKMNTGVYWLLLAIVFDVFSTFLSAKANGLEHKFEQIIALILYIASFVCCAIALKYMKTGILYVLWSGIGVVATAFLSRVYLGQVIDVSGWIGIAFIVIGLMIIAQFSNINV